MDLSRPPALPQLSCARKGRSSSEGMSLHHSGRERYTSGAISTCFALTGFCLTCSRYVATAKFTVRRLKQGSAVQWTLAADMYCQYISALITGWRGYGKTGWRAVWRSLLFSCYSKSRHGYSSDPAIAWHDSPRSHTTAMSSIQPAFASGILSILPSRRLCCMPSRQRGTRYCVHPGQGSMLTRLHLR